MCGMQRRGYNTLLKCYGRRGDFLKARIRAIEAFRNAMHRNCPKLQQCTQPGLEKEGLAAVCNLSLLPLQRLCGETG